MTQIYTEREKLFSMSIVAHRQQLLDRTVFETLIDETSPQVVFDIMSAFITTLDEAINQLRSSQEITQSQLYRLSHKVKGSSLLVGFTKLGELCRELTISAQESQAETVEPYVVKRLLSSLEEVKSCVEIIQK